ncbi:MAG TPA: class I SAM-dependent methyltransferase [Planctomycetota bacterium]|nr:class I SAM-dependent methyltransferase [Planctomycetota bacterium]
MERLEIEREVRRLSPWYYLYDLDGVRTDLLPPCDRHGHRAVSLTGSGPFLAGRSVLDVGCNEGGYSFAALDNGAAHVTGIDVRPVNVEKARFVARVKGRTKAEFYLASCDEWLARDPEPVDVVFLCGLLYHLVEPWKTIEQYCALAREGVFVTCVLAGGPDGYTPFPEQENIAASADPALVSQMPNTSRTIVEEFEKHGFLPRYIAESRSEFFWGGCWLFLQNCNEWRGRWSKSPQAGEEVDLYLTPHPRRSPSSESRKVEVVLYNRGARARELARSAHAYGADGSHLHALGPERLVLPARVASPEDRMSESVSVTLDLASLPPETSSVQVLVHDPERGTVVASGKLLV